MFKHFGCIGSYVIHNNVLSLLPFLKIMQALVEHYSRKGWLQRVEQCVLHMDISSLDFNQVCTSQIFAYNFIFIFYVALVLFVVVFTLTH